MKKEFVNYEQALALKGLGFDENIFYKYYYLGNKDSSLKNSSEIEYFENKLIAPLYQQAFRWFREKCRLDNNIYECVKVSGDDTYNFRITGIKNYNFFYDVRANYALYEEAELACLNKLIEIAQKEK